MTTPYRNETDALRERKAALEQETAALRAQKAQLDWLSEREAELARELSSIEDRLNSGAKRTLPMLDQISVASPCSAKWDDMMGDDRARFCLSCDKNVYNITALTREDAEKFLQERAGGDVCIRYFQRADGTIMTSDCAVGVKKKRRKKALFAIAGAGILAAGFVTYTKETMVMGKMAPHEGGWVAGGMMAPPVDPSAKPVEPIEPNAHNNIADEGQWVGGAMAPPIEAPPKAVPKVMPRTPRTR